MPEKIDYQIGRLNFSSIAQKKVQSPLGKFQSYDG